MRMGGIRKEKVRYVWNKAVVTNDEKKRTRWCCRPSHQDHQAKYVVTRVSTGRGTTQDEDDSDDAHELLLGLAYWPAIRPMRQQVLAGYNFKFEWISACNKGVPEI